MNTFFNLVESVEMDLRTIEHVYNDDKPLYNTGKTLIDYIMTLDREMLVVEAFMRPCKLSCLIDNKDEAFDKKDIDSIAFTFRTRKGTVGFLTMPERKEGIVFFKV